MERPRIDRQGGPVALQSNVTSPAAKPLRVFIVWKSPERTNFAIPRSMTIDVLGQAGRKSTGLCSSCGRSWHTGHNRDHRPSIEVAIWRATGMVGGSARRGQEPATPRSSPAPMQAAMAIMVRRVNLIVTQWVRGGRASNHARRRGSPTDRRHSLRAAPPAPMGVCDLRCAWFEARRPTSENSCPSRCLARASP